MSSGYLILSKTKADSIQKNRYMKFEKLNIQGQFHVYTRMEYLNQGNYQLIEKDMQGLHWLTNYAVSFFQIPKLKNSYFSYFTLQKNRELEDVVKAAVDFLLSSKKVETIFLSDRKKSSILCGEIYQLSY